MISVRGNGVQFSEMGEFCFIRVGDSDPDEDLLPNAVCVEGEICPVPVRTLQPAQKPDHVLLPWGPLEHPESPDYRRRRGKAGFVR